MRFLLAPLALAGALLLLQAQPSQARDNGRYADVPAATRDWFKSLHSAGGAWCCDEADGARLEDPYWRIEGDGYAVLRDGIWQRVPADALVPGRNRVGFAVVWPATGRILCFMPGAVS